MVFDSPFASAPVSHLLFDAPGAVVEVAVCTMSPTLVNVIVEPSFTRVRAGQKAYSTLLSPILIVLVPSAIGPSGPAIRDGGVGGGNGATVPFMPNTHNASPLALPWMELPPVMMAMYFSAFTGVYGGVHNILMWHTQQNQVWYHSLGGFASGNSFGATTFNACKFTLITIIHFYSFPQWCSHR